MKFCKKKMQLKLKTVDWINMLQKSEFRDLGFN